MLSKSRLKDLVLMIILVVLIGGVAHFAITNPLGPSRLLYYIQAPLIQGKTQCSEGAPVWLAALQKYATRNMAAPASQLAYITPAGQLHHCETGWEDAIFGDVAVQSDTRFRFASTTKTVTAAAIIGLVNTGQLSLNTRVIELLELEGDTKDPKVADITIEHLLSHRGGWDRSRTLDVMFLIDGKPWCPENPDQLLNAELMYDPGEKELYSNLGYCLLGLVIEKVTGKPYRDYIAGHFGFENNAFAFIDGPYLADEVRYDMRHENFYDENYYTMFDFYALSSSAGLSGNAVDLAMLVSRAIAQKPISILDGDMSSGCDPSLIQSCYGYGLYRYQPEPADMPLYTHGGKLPGNPTAIIVDPKGGVHVWLGAGGPRPGSNETREFYDYLRERLTTYYAADR